MNSYQKLQLRNYLFSFLLFFTLFFFLIYFIEKKEKYKVHTEIRIIKYGNIEVKKDTIDVITINKQL